MPETLSEVMRMIRCNPSEPMEIGTVKKLLMDARREFADICNRKFGADIRVYFNEDLESYNFNYTHNIEQMAQDVYAGNII